MKNKIVVGLILIGLIGGHISLAQQAVTVVGGQVNANEINPVVVTSAQTTAVSTAKTFGQQILEWGQKFLLETLRKRLLDMIVDQIIQWIQGGGEPKFITDWQGLLRDAADQAAGDFISKELGLGFLCQPFNLQIQIALQNPGPFSQRAACTLDQIVGNIEDFSNDFRNGGWIAYSESWKPQNNYYGALMMAEQELSIRSSSAQFNAWSEGIAGGGFLSTKDCEEGEVGPPGLETMSVEDIDGDGNPGDIPSTCKIKTPGSVIGEIAADAIGSDIPYIINAQELEAYVSAIADAAINRLIKEGVNGLQGMSSSQAPSSGYVTSGSSSPCAGLTGAALEACLRYGQNTSDSFDYSRDAIMDQIDATLGPRLDAQRSIESSLSLLRNYQDNLDTLNDQLVDLDRRQNVPPALCYLSKPQLQQQITDAINEENPVIADLQQQLTANQVIIDGLLAKNEELAAIPNEEWDTLNSTISTITSQLDPVSAVVLREDAADENDAIRSRTTQTLNSFRNQVNICYE